MTLVSKFLGEEGSAPETAPILFVEDSPDDFFIAQRELKRLRISSPIDRVDSVPDMLDYLKDRGECGLPCAIIMDLTLRGESGLAGQAKVRSNLKYHRIPVIAISSIDQLTSLKAAMQLGASGFLFKPFNADEFLKLAAKLKLRLDFDAVS